MYEKTINCNKKYNIVQHMKTTIHHDHLKRFTAKAAKQQTISKSIATGSTRDEQSSFCHDLCRAMISSNIPLEKLENNKFKFFCKSFVADIPIESTIRKNYVDSVYMEVRSKIKNKIGEN